MSQAKVDKYKENKKNRKKINAREKMKMLCAKIVAAAIGVAIVGWAGYSGYSIYESKQPAKQYYCDTTALDDYMDSISY